MAASSSSTLMNSVPTPDEITQFTVLVEHSLMEVYSKPFVDTDFAAGRGLPLVREKIQDLVKEYNNLYKRERTRDPVSDLDSYSKVAALGATILVNKSTLYYLRHFLSQAAMAVEWDSMDLFLMPVRNALNACDLRLDFLDPSFLTYGNVVRRKLYAGGKGTPRMDNIINEYASRVIHDAVRSASEGYLKLSNWMNDFRNYNFDIQGFFAKARVTYLNAQESAAVIFHELMDSNHHDLMYPKSLIDIFADHHEIEQIKELCDLLDRFIFEKLNSKYLEYSREIKLYIYSMLSRRSPAEHDNLYQQLVIQQENITLGQDIEADLQAIIAIAKGYAVLEKYNDYLSWLDRKGIDEYLLSKSDFTSWVDVSANVNDEKLIPSLLYVAATLSGSVSEQEKIMAKTILERYDFLFEFPLKGIKNIDFGTKCFILVLIGICHTLWDTLSSFLQKIGELKREELQPPNPSSSQQNMHDLIIAKLCDYFRYSRFPESPLLTLFQYSRTHCDLRVISSSFFGLATHVFSPHYRPKMFSANPDSSIYGMYEKLVRNCEEKTMSLPLSLVGDESAQSPDELDKRRTLALLEGGISAIPYLACDVFSKQVGFNESGSKNRRILSILLATISISHSSTDADIQRFRHQTLKYVMKPNAKSSIGFSFLCGLNQANFESVTNRILERASIMTPLVKQMGCHTTILWDQHGESDLHRTLWCLYLLRLSKNKDIPAVIRASICSYYLGCSERVAFQILSATPVWRNSFSIFRQSSGNVDQQNTSLQNVASSSSSSGTSTLKKARKA